MLDAPRIKVFIEYRGTTKQILIPKNNHTLSIEELS